MSNMILTVLSRRSQRGGTHFFWCGALALLKTAAAEATVVDIPTGQFQVWAGQILDDSSSTRAWSRLEEEEPKMGGEAAKEISAKLQSAHENSGGKILLDERAAQLVECCTNFGEWKPIAWRSIQSDSDNEEEETKDLVRQILLPNEEEDRSMTYWKVPRSPDMENMADFYLSGESDH